MQQMTDEKMLMQRAEVAALQQRVGLTLLHGTELDIAADGSVDWDAGLLEGSTSASPQSRRNTGFTNNVPCTGSPSIRSSG